MSDHEYDDIHDLLVRAPAPDLTYDLSATLATGRRVRRRRRLAAVSGGVAALAAVAIAFGAFGPLPGGNTQPAGPGTGSSSTEILDYRYAVEIGPSGAGRPAIITVFSVDAGKRTRIDRWTAKPGVITEAPKEIAPGILLLVAPARARTFTLVTESDVIRAIADPKPLVGTDYQVVTFALPTDTKAATPSDIIWTDATGAFDQAGKALPSVVNPTTGEVLVLDTQRRLIMSQRPDGGSGSDYPAGSTPWTGDNFDTRSSSIQFLSATLVIPTQGLTAKDVTVRWNNGISTNATTLGKPGSEWTFLHTERTASPKVETGEVYPTDVEWTDPSGTRHGEPVKR
ncbi:hypothetical protein JNB_07539 [Janibacter sp. HTCC2649]|uniref:hypothetical protein n=1 Tax=Janibacter sp. HTCC2649 TaxID=313589 RepID=UPI0000670D3B|nr:hypothetical protein [Janibacter sp. HTCC2649]EAQ00005.1 hypothetical protein JNB_07539 [Janibacter sp. HTCC2649]